MQLHDGDDIAGRAAAFAAEHGLGSDVVPRLVELAHGRLVAAGRAPLAEVSA